MVMDRKQQAPPPADTVMTTEAANPTPISVGREFVRQYYTLLNHAPLHLHRFYSHNSTFVHGDLATEVESVQGQMEIHGKIQQLDFRECHAKIHRVDAHATIGQGVVVQVAGELSNNGLPHRKFVQTFVLAPQSPKKYYVHNDIFRYQDEFRYLDNEQAEPPVAVVTNGEYGGEKTETGSVPIGPVVVSIEKDGPPTVSVAAAMNQPEAQTSKEEVAEEEPKQQPPVSAPEERPAAPRQPVSPMATSTASSSIEASSPPEITQPQAAAAKEEPAKAPENMTYANRVKSSASHPPGVAYPGGQKPPMAGGGAPTGLPSGAPGESTEGKDVGKPPPFKGPPRAGSGIGSRGGSSGRERFGSVNREDETGETRRRPAMNSNNGGGVGSQSLPDSHQLFVGNLPHNCEESQLEKLFSKFGHVVEVRINSKGASQSKLSPSGGRVPNFGFVVFADEKSVAKALKEKPIFLPPDSHRLNIEEKKNKPGRDGVSGGGGGGRGGFNDRGSQEHLGGGNRGLER